MQVDASRPFGLPPLRWRIALAGGCVVAVALLMAFAGHVLGMPGLRGSPAFFNDWVVSGVSVFAFLGAAARARLVAAERRLWTILAAGLGSYAAGAIAWSFWLDAMETPPFPSVADALWLVLYPCAYLACMALARRTLPRLPSSAWLDGAIASLTGGAVLAAFVYAPLSASATGSAMAIATNIAYPLFDVVLVATVLFVMVARSSRPDPRWTTLGVAALAFAAADTLFANSVVDGVYVPEALPNLFWTIGLVTFGVAGWMPSRPARRRDLAGWGTLAVPLVFAFLALGMLVVSASRVENAVTVTAAGLAVACALLRMALTFREVETLAASRREALTDDLTGLPNRRCLMRHLGAEERRGGVALLLLDLDDFKEVNDALGHHAGDILLAAIGDRMRRLAPHDALVARLGGDEFAIALPHRGEDPVHVAQRLVAGLGDPFDIDGLRLHTRASIGIALPHRGAARPADLMRCADVAMYNAKRTRSSWEVYESGHDEHTRDRLALVDELNEAIEGDALTVFLQPQVEPRTRRVEAFEALVRWQHPQRGLLTPGDFLPLAERAQLMRPLFRCMLRQSLRQLRRWDEEGRHARVAVNLSVSDALSETLVDDVRSALEHSGLAPGRLKLEITEEAFLGDADGVRASLRALAALGVGISLDDYGTGEASLSRLKDLPLEELKIDRGFVRDIATDRADEAIVASTVELCHRLGVRVVAEGVEDEAGVERLAALGCDLVQGYATGRPAPAAEQVAWIATTGVPGGAPADAVAAPSPHAVG